MNARLSDIEVALTAAAAGAAVVRAAYGGEIHRYAKAGAEVTTDLDIAAERAILEVLAAARPADGTVGEETGTIVGTSGRRWLVDPLCGTLNFVARTALAAVNVALVEGSTTLACVCADPVADEVFWGNAGGGFLRSGGSDQPLHPSAESTLVDINCDGPRDEAFVGPQLLADRGFQTAFAPRVVSTTLAVAWVAAGRRAGYVSDGQLNDNVHFAAGIGLCRFAGCVSPPSTAGRSTKVAA